MQIVEVPVPAELDLAAFADELGRAAGIPAPPLTLRPGPPTTLVIGTGHVATDPPPIPEAVIRATVAAHVAPPPPKGTHERLALDAAAAQDLAALRAAVVDFARAGGRRRGPGQ